VIEHHPQGSGAAGVFRGLLAGAESFYQLQSGSYFPVVEIRPEEVRRCLERDFPLYRGSAGNRIGFRPPLRIPVEGTPCRHEQSRDE
jgi:hypothetical protein